MSDDGPGPNSNRDDRDQRASAGRAAHEFLKWWTSSPPEPWCTCSKEATACSCLEWQAFLAGFEARERLGRDEAKDGATPRDAA